MGKPGPRGDGRPRCPGLGGPGRGSRDGVDAQVWGSCPLVLPSQCGEAPGARRAWAGGHSSVLGQGPGLGFGLFMGLGEQGEPDLKVTMRLDADLNGAPAPAPGRPCFLLRLGWFGVDVVGPGLGPVGPPDILPERGLGRPGSVLSGLQQERLLGDCSEARPLKARTGPPLPDSGSQQSMFCWPPPSNFLNQD